MEITILYLDDITLKWYIWTEDRYLFKNWQDFQFQFEKQFGTFKSGNMYQPLLDIKQEGRHLIIEKNSNTYLPFSPRFRKKS